MGSFVLTVCLFNFIAGFLAAVFLHNPRLFRVPKRKQLEDGDSGGQEQTSTAPDEEQKPRLIRWKLPLEWTEMLMEAQVSTSPAVIPVLQGLRLWHKSFQPRLTDCEARIRVAIDADEPGPAVSKAIARLTALGDDWRRRLKQASKLLRYLMDDAAAKELDDVVHDFSMQIKATVEEVRSLDRDYELRSSGVKHYLLEVGELARQSHIMHEALLRRLSLALEAQGELEDAPAEWAHDPITGLNNCLGFFQSFSKLAPAEESRERMRICVLKLDRFAIVNQRVGSKAADKMLAAFGALLLDLSMDSEESLAPVRLFGSAIALFLGDADQNLAETSAERMRQAVEASSFQLGEESVHGTVSCAIVEIRGGQTAEETLRRLSALLFLLDDAGGNHTATDMTGEPNLIEPRAFQVQARLVQPV